MVFLVPKKVYNFKIPPQNLHNKSFTAFLRYIQQFLAQTCYVKTQSSNLTQCTVKSETANDVRRMSERDRYMQNTVAIEIERASNDSISTMRRDSTLQKKLRSARIIIIINICTYIIIISILECTKFFDARNVDKSSRHRDKDNWVHGPTCTITMDLFEQINTCLYYTCLCNFFSRS